MNTKRLWTLRGRILLTAQFLGGRESFLKHDIERSKTNNNEIRTNSFEEIMQNLKAQIFSTPGVSVPPNMRTFSDF